MWVIRDATSVENTSARLLGWNVLWQQESATAFLQQIIDIVVVAFDFSYLSDISSHWAATAGGRGSCPDLLVAAEERFLLGPAPIPAEDWKNPADGQYRDADRNLARQLLLDLLKMEARGCKCKPLIFAIYQKFRMFIISVGVRDDETQE